MVHLGKRPIRMIVENDWVKDIIGLRVQLEAAVKTEDYSLAISLRDAIKQMESAK